MSQQSQEKEIHLIHPLSGEKVKFSNSLLITSNPVVYFLIYALITLLSIFPLINLLPFVLYLLNKNYKGRYKVPEGKYYVAFFVILLILFNLSGIVAILQYSGVLPFNLNNLTVTSFSVLGYPIPVNLLTIIIAAFSFALALGIIVVGVRAEASFNLNQRSKEAWRLLWKGIGLPSQDFEGLNTFFSNLGRKSFTRRKLKTVQETLKGECKTAIDNLVNHIHGSLLGATIKDAQSAYSSIEYLSRCIQNKQTFENMIARKTNIKLTEEQIQTLAYGFVGKKHNNWFEGHLAIKKLNAVKRGRVSNDALIRYIQELKGQKAGLRWWVPWGEEGSCYCTLETLRSLITGFSEKLVVETQTLAIKRIQRTGFNQRLRAALRLDKTEQDVKVDENDNNQVAYTALIAESDKYAASCMENNMLINTIVNARAGIRTSYYNKLVDEAKERLETVHQFNQALRRKIGDNDLKEAAGADAKDDEKKDDDVADQNQEVYQGLLAASNEVYVDEVIKELNSIFDKLEKRIKREAKIKHKNSNSSYSDHLKPRQQIEMYNKISEGLNALLVFANENQKKTIRLRITAVENQIKIVNNKIKLSKIQNNNDNRDDDDDINENFNALEFLQCNKDLRVPYTGNATTYNDWNQEKTAFEQERLLSYKELMAAVEREWEDEKQNKNKPGDKYFLNQMKSYLSDGFYNTSGEKVYTSSGKPTQASNEHMLLNNKNKSNNNNNVNYNNNANNTQSVSI